MKLGDLIHFENAVQMCSNKTSDISSNFLQLRT